MPRPELGVLAVCAWAACGSLGCARQPAPALKHATSARHAPAADFLHRLLRPWPAAAGPLLLAVSSDASDHVSSYDNALLALYLLRSGERPEAGRILQALAALQQPDGAIPFSFAWPSPDPNALYVRTGAAAWVGYAATEYLNADRAGPAREQIAKLAYLIANYILEHQVTATGDARDGLVTGGAGSYRLELDGERVRESYVAGEVDWVSTEHNIDAYFFLRDFGKLTGQPRFAAAAERIRAGLSARGFMPAAGQLARGFEAASIDSAYALDCASWGALFFVAAGDALRAETSLASAEWRYASREPATGAGGHRPYAHAPIFENAALAARMREKLGASNWDELEGVWPEGSAGVALAELRLGHRTRAEAILEQLERLRTVGGGVPTFTLEVPFELDAQASLAGTVWIELVRYELARSAGSETLWRAR